jgi:hypothetical protein
MEEQHVSQHDPRIMGYTREVPQPGIPNAESQTIMLKLKCGDKNLHLSDHQLADLGERAHLISCAMRIRRPGGVLTMQNLCWLAGLRHRYRTSKFKVVAYISYRFHDLHVHCPLLCPCCSTLHLASSLPGICCCCLYRKSVAHLQGILS